MFTSTKLATYSASAVKCNFGNFGGYKSLNIPLGTPLMSWYTTWTMYLIAN